MTKTILIIEDDVTLQGYLKELLSQENYSIKKVTDETSTIETIENVNPDLVLLDLILPKINGEALCKEIKKNFPNLPVIVLTGKTNMQDKLNVLGLGADDYITKPFVPEELVLRIKARLKNEFSNDYILKIDDLEIDTQALIVKRNKKEISLTPHEYKLLEYLVHNAGKVLTRESLLNKIWPNSFDIETRVIDVYISYLRKKIDKGHKNKLLRSVRGFGYSINANQK